jgi:hypothetical protein
MIGKRIARRFFRDAWGEDWTPPWFQPDWPGPGFRGPWGPGPRGPWGRGPWGPGYGHGRWASPEQQALRSTAAEVARLFVIASRSAWDNPDRQAQLRSFLERSRKELTDIIYGADQGTPPSSSTNVEQA